MAPGLKIALPNPLNLIDATEFPEHAFCAGKWDIWNPICGIGTAVLATFWVLFVFSASGWMISLMGSQPESLVARNSAYQDSLFQALQDPTGREELRNIYFGALMGLSAALPTLTHVYCSLRAAVSSIRGAAPIQA